MRSLLKPNEQVSLWAISIDSQAESKAFAEKIASDGRGKVAFPILSDARGQVVNAYGLRDPRYEGQKIEGVPYPSVFVIDKAGRVAWARVDEDYKQRPKNSEIRAALDALK